MSKRSRVKKGAKALAGIIILFPVVGLTSVALAVISATFRHGDIRY